MAKILTLEFSSHQEWPDCPHTFLSAYRLEHDKSWTKLEHIARRDQEMKIIGELLDKGKVPSLTYLDTMPVEVEDKLLESSEDMVS